jgi:hypothetical protein
MALPDTENPSCPKHETYMVPTKLELRLDSGKEKETVHGFKCPNPDCDIVYVAQRALEGLYVLKSNGEIEAYTK